MTEKTEPFHSLRARFAMVAAMAAISVAVSYVINVGMAEAGEGAEHARWVKADIIQKTIRKSVDAQVKDSVERAMQVQPGAQDTFNIQVQGIVDADDLEKRTQEALKAEHDEHRRVAKVEAMLFAPLTMSFAWFVTGSRRRVPPGPSTPKV